MSPTSQDRLLRVANNALLLLVSRMAMAATPIVASLLVYLGGFYLEARFDQSRAAVADLDQRLRAVQAQADRVTIAVADVKAQLALTNQAADISGKTALGWQVSVNNRLDKMTDALTSLSTAVAALNATVQQINR